MRRKKKKRKKEGEDPFSIFCRRGKRKELGGKGDGRQLLSPSSEGGKNPEGKGGGKVRGEGSDRVLAAIHIIMIVTRWGRRVGEKERKEGKKKDSFFFLLFSFSSTPKKEKERKKEENVAASHISLRKNPLSISARKRMRP